MYSCKYCLFTGKSHEHMFACRAMLEYLAYWVGSWILDFKPRSIGPSDRVLDLDPKGHGPSEHPRKPTGISGLARAQVVLLGYRGGLRPKYSTSTSIWRAKVTPVRLLVGSGRVLLVVPWIYALQFLVWVCNLQASLSPYFLPGRISIIHSCLSIVLHISTRTPL